MKWVYPACIEKSDTLSGEYLSVNSYYTDDLNNSFFYFSDKKQKIEHQHDLDESG
jgi:hypothetical protein